MDHAGEATERRPATRCHCQQPQPRTTLTAAATAKPSTERPAYGATTAALTALKTSVTKVDADITAPRRAGTRSSISIWMLGKASPLPNATKEMPTTAQGSTSPAGVRATTTPIAAPAVLTA